MKKKTQLINVEYKFEKRKVNYLMLSTNVELKVMPYQLDN